MIINATFYTNLLLHCLDKIYFQAVLFALVFSIISDSKIIHYTLRNMLYQIELKITKQIRKYSLCIPQEQGHKYSRAHYSRISRIRDDSDDRTHFGSILRSPMHNFRTIDPCIPRGIRTSPPNYYSRHWMKHLRLTQPPIVD